MLFIYTCSVSLSSFSSKCITHSMILVNLQSLIPREKDMTGINASEKW